MFVSPHCTISGNLLSSCVYLYILEQTQLSILKSKKKFHQIFCSTFVYKIIFCVMLRYLLGILWYNTPTVHDVFPLSKSFVSTPWNKVNMGTTFSKNCLLLRTRYYNKILRLLLSYDIFRFIEISPSLF